MSTERSGGGTIRTILVVAVVLLLLPAVVMVLVMPMMGMGMMSGGEMAVSPVWGLGAMLLWIAVLAAIALLFYRLLKRRLDRGVADPALQELRLAYARGDVTEEEYEQRRERLRGRD